MQKPKTKFLHVWKDSTGRSYTTPVVYHIANLETVLANTRRVGSTTVAILKF